MILIDVEIGTIMSLTHCTKKGKERLKRDGCDNWVVRTIRNNVQFSQESGPWLLIDKVDDNGLVINKNISRWIHHNNDDDFKITEIK